MGSHDDVRESIGRSLAGDFYDRMKLSSEFTRAQLANPIAGVRTEALYACFRWWKITDENFRNACRAMAKSDPDVSVRIQAVTTLGAIMMGSKAEKDSEFLARIALDPMSTEGLRNEAYFALRKIQLGLRISDLMSRFSLIEQEALANEKFRQVNDPKGIRGAESAKIDWEFVKKFAS